MSNSLNHNNIPHFKPQCIMHPRELANSQGCCTLTFSPTFLLEGVLAQALSTDGKILHIVRNRLTQILVNI